MSQMNLLGLNHWCFAFVSLSYETNLGEKEKSFLLTKDLCNAITESICFLLVAHTAKRFAELSALLHASFCFFPSS